MRRGVSGAHLPGFASLAATRKLPGVGGDTASRVGAKEYQPFDLCMEIPEAFAEYLPGRAMTGTSAPGHRGASISGVFSVTGRDTRHLLRSGRWTGFMRSATYFKININVISVHSGQRVVLMGRTPAIILTTDETMMSTYRGGMFLGFSTCAPQGILPDWLFFLAFAPPVMRRDGRAVYADLGLRTVEASLIRDGFSEEEVAVVHPLDFKSMIGDETRIVAIGVHDPLGINPPTSTFVDIARTGPPYNRIKFLELVKNPLLSGLTTIVGGKGAWQVSDPAVMEKLHIDHIHQGMGEVSMPRVCRQILDGEEVPRIIEGEEVPAEDIPNILRPTIHGLVEISRGCGRGCAFCTPGGLKVVHKSLDHIARDIEVNVRAGSTTALLHSEDVLRYGSKGIAAEPEKVLRLVDRVTAIEGVETLACSHIALATAYHHPDLVDQVSEKALSLPKAIWIGSQTGIETGSPRLMEQHMGGKCLPSKPGTWHDIVVESISHLSDAGWVLACTMVVGLPGETEEDVLLTRDLVEELRGLRVFLVPMNFVAMGGSRLSLEDSFTADKMTSAHWALLGSCIEHDVHLARGIKDAVYTGSLPVRLLGKYVSERLIRGGESFARSLKDGNPPRDYSVAGESYLVPEI